MTVITAGAAVVASGRSSLEIFASGRFSLEIVTLLFSTTLAMSGFFQNNLLLRKACNSTVPFGLCTDGEAHAQHVVSVIYSWKACIQYVVPVVLIILSGPWSDSHGRRRRPLMFIPIFGQILTDALCLLNVYFWTWPPQIAAVFEAVTPGLFGARTMFWVGLKSYISDSSPSEVRTLKYGIVNAIATISRLIGTGLAGYLNVGLGFYGAFAVSIALNLVALSVGLLTVKDHSVPYDKSVVWLRPKVFLKNYLSVFKGATKSFSYTLVALLLCNGVLVGRTAGENTITYLYMRYKFHWYEVKYSYFAAFKMLTVFFGTLFSVSVLSHQLKINDAIIGCVACAFDVLAAVCYVFVAEPWQLFIIPVVDLFHGTALTISTSLTSKIVDAGQLGRINSLQGLCTTLLLFVIIFAYSTTYHLTFEYLAGAVYLLSVVLTVPVLIVLGIIYGKCKHLWTKETTTQTECKEKTTD